MKRPWMPLYVGDYLADTGHLSTEEHGAYFLLILHYWVTESLPNDSRSLANLARLPLKKWNAIETKLKPFFGPSWSHKRLDEEIEKSKKISSERARAGASKSKANVYQLLNKS